MRWAVYLVYWIAFRCHSIALYTMDFKCKFRDVTYLRTLGTIMQGLLRESISSAVEAKESTSILIFVLGRDKGFSKLYFLLLMRMCPCMKNILP